MMRVAQLLRLGRGQQDDAAPPSMSAVPGALPPALPQLDLERGIELEEPGLRNRPEGHTSVEWRGSTSTASTKVDIETHTSLHPLDPLNPSLDDESKKAPSRPLSIIIPDQTPSPPSEPAVGEYTGQRLQDSPVQGYGPGSLRRQHKSFASQDSTSSSSGLDERAAELLEDAERCGLQWGLPSDTQIWDRPAGWQRVEENEIPPAPPGPLSGLFRSHDKHDEHRHLIGLKRLEENSWFERTTQDGAPYFVNPSMRFMTDDYIRDRRLFARVQRWASKLYDIIEAQQKTTCPDVLWWPRDYELYLSVGNGQNPGDELCFYYFLDYGTRHVFWLHSLEWSRVFPDLHERASSASIDVHLKYEFWYHLSLFPHSDLFPSEAEHDVRERLKWSCFDMAVSRNSTSPYSQVQASEFLDLLDRCKDDKRDSRVKRAILARLMVTYLRGDLQTRFGELGARIDRMQPPVEIQDDRLPPFRRLCYACAHVLLFGTDIPHLTMIRNIAVDNVVPQAQWMHHIDRFLKETEQSNIIAALFFTGNIGFLALNNLGEDISITVVISTMMSLASLLIGLHHVRQYGPLENTFADMGAAYFGEVRETYLGYRGLALFYCLPWGLLVWSIIWFTLSVFLWMFTNLCTTQWCYGLTIAFGVAILFTVAGTLRFSSQLWKGKNPRCRMWDGLVCSLVRLFWSVAGMVRAIFDSPSKEVT